MTLRRPPRGQALVELALAFPIVMFILLGGIDGARLLITKADQDHRTIVVAEWAAAHPGDSSWNSIAAHELPGCTVTLDDTGRPGIVTAGSTCTFDALASHGLGLFDNIPISSEADAAIGPAGLTPTPEPSSTASPS